MLYSNGYCYDCFTDTEIINIENRGLSFIDTPLFFKLYFIPL